MRLTGAMVYVKDLGRMGAFYRAMLGIAPSKVDSTWMAFDTAGGTFALHAIPAAMASGIETASPPRPRETAAVKLLFGVRDVDAERLRLEGLGITMVQRPWGDWDGIDPEGNVFGLRPVVSRDQAPDPTLL
jgi:predicted enzyme related to lactoylglutathione lyase